MSKGKKEAVGSWWSPTDTDHSYLGKLTYKRGRPHLTIRAPKWGQGSIKMLAHRSTLHGVLNSGERVTLWDPHDQPAIHHRQRRDSAWLRSSRYFTHAVIGDHLEQLEATDWLDVAVRFGGMTEWSRMLAPIPSGTVPESLPQYPSATVVDPISAEMVATVTLENPQRIESDADSGIESIRNFTGKDSQFHITFSAPTSVEHSERMLADLQQFMAFAFQSSAVFEFERVKRETDEEWMFVRTRHATDEGYQPTHQWHRMLLRADDFDLSVVLPNWYRLLDDVFPVLQVLAMRVNTRTRLVESSASSALAAAERLHEHISAGRERFGPEVLKANQDLILAAVPGRRNAPYRAFLREVTGSARPTLQTKLEELFDAMDPGVAVELGIDRDVWIKESKAVRNPLAHTGSHVGHRIADPKDPLDRVEAQTRAILSLLVLGLLEVPLPGIKRAAGVLKVEMTIWNKV